VKFNILLGVQPNKLFFLWLFLPFVALTANLQDTTNELASLAKAKQFYLRADSLKKSDPQQALVFNREALSYAHDVQSSETLADINRLMGELYITENNLQPAINYFLISEKLYTEFGDKKELATVYGHLGRMYYNNNFELDKALMYYNKMMDIAMELNDKELLAASYDNLGSLFLSLHDKDKAYTYYHQLLLISEEINNQTGIGKALNNIGEIERYRGDYKKAFDYYKQSLAIHRELNDIRKMAINMENMGITYYTMNRPDDALHYYRQSLQYYQKANDRENIASVLVLMGRNAIKLEQYDTAIVFYNRAKNIAAQNGYHRYFMRALKGLSRAYEKKNDAQKALEYFKHFEVFKDSIFRLKERNNIAAIKAQLLTELDNTQYKLQKYEIEMLTKDKKIYRLKMNILISILIIIFLSGVLLTVRYKIIVKKQRQLREKDSELHQAQQELLKSELNSKDSDLMSFALHIVQKNKLLKELGSDLRELSKNGDSETSKRLREMSLNIKQMLKIQEDIDLFDQKVSQTYDGFFHKIKEHFPTLTKNEERLCAMLKLKLSSKEIASINNTSVKAVEMSRYRLRKKCGIDNNTNLSEYISCL
jgi:tetratricopeptide (TPR) repeat protein